MTEHSEIRIPDAHQEILAANSLGVLSTMRHRDGRISTNPVGYVWDGTRVRISPIGERRNPDFNPHAACICATRASLSFTCAATDHHCPTRILSGTGQVWMKTANSGPNGLLHWWPISGATHPAH